MKRPLALVGLLLVPLVVVAGWLAVIEMISPPYDSVSLSPEPPAGFVFHSLISDPQPGPISERQGIGVTLGSPTNGQVVFGANVRSYPTAWQERVMTFGSAKPRPSYVNFEEGVASPVLNGIGLGSDAIQCGDGQPDSCRAWVYWGHVGNQLVTAGLFLGDNEPDMSADEFRRLIDELLDY